MSMCYWGVVGYGIAVTEDMFDEKKLKNMPSLSDLEEEDWEEGAIWDNGMLQDIVDDLSPNYLGFGDTGNMDDGQFFMYFAQYPWSMSDEEKNLTKEDINKLIVEGLLPYVKDEYTEEWIRERIHDISVGGAG